MMQRLDLEKGYKLGNEESYSVQRYKKPGTTDCFLGFLCLLLVVFIVVNLGIMLPFQESAKTIITILRSLNCSSSDLHKQQVWHKRYYLKGGKRLESSVLIQVLSKQHSTTMSSIYSVETYEKIQAFLANYTIPRIQRKAAITNKSHCSTKAKVNHKRTRPRRQRKL